MKMKVINMAMKKVGDDKLRRKVVSFLLVTLMMATITPVPVSYTHLDVYKRQIPDCTWHDGG